MNTKKQITELTIEELKNKKLFSFNDMKKRFENMKHRIKYPNLVKVRFLEDFENTLIYFKYSKLEKKEELIIQIKRLIENHAEMVNNDLEYPEFEPSKYENNIDFIMDQNYDNNDFNVGYEQSRRATYNEILRLLE